MSTDLTVEQSFTFASGDSFLYHSMFTKAKGWHWIEKWSLEPYRIVMMNPAQRKIYSYCEGDLYRTTAQTQEAFVKEIKRQAGFYKEGY